MRSLLVLASLPSISQARLFPFGDVPEQHPMSNQGPGIQLPNKPSAEDSASNADIILSDVIGSHRQIQIFAGFTRDISSISSRLDDPSKNTTLLAPINSAITSLPRKPWEDPQEYSAFGASAYEGKDGEDRAHKNMRRFAEAHVVPQSPWKEGEKVVEETSARVKLDSFEHCVVEVRKEDLSGFLEGLSAKAVVG